MLNTTHLSRSKNVLTKHRSEEFQQEPLRSSPRKQFLGGAFGAALFAVLLGTSGCSIGRLAANQIVMAPNLQRAVPTNYIAAWWTNFFPKGSSNPLVWMTIPVGPPEARMQGRGGISAAGLSLEI